MPLGFSLAGLSATLALQGLGAMIAEPLFTHKLHRIACWPAFRVLRMRLLFSLSAARLSCEDRPIACAEIDDLQAERLLIARYENTMLGVIDSNWPGQNQGWSLTHAIAGDG